MLYLYCLTEAGVSDLAALALGEKIFIDFHEFTIIATEPAEYQPSSSEYIMEHYRVSNQILKNGFTVLPFAYGTIIPISEIHSFAQSKRPDILANLAGFKGKIEMGTKIIILNKDEAEKPFRKLGNTPGHQYMARCFKKESLLLTNLERIQELCRDIDRVLGPFFIKKKVKIKDMKTTLINVAFLLHNKSEAGFLDSLDLLSSIHKDCRFLVSGPWPPYNFINLTG